MSVRIDFELDTKDGMKTKSIKSPFADLNQTRDNIESRLDDMAGKSSALMPVRDAETGQYVFVHTMKIGAIRVYEEDTDE